MYLKNNPDHRSFIGDSFDAFLLVTEEKLQNSNTYLNSQTITVADEFQNANLTD
jgi:hypothetical protein